MARTYLRIFRGATRAGSTPSTRARALAVSSAATLILLAAACGGKKDQPAPAQEPPKVVKVADLEPAPTKGNRYAKATFLVQISLAIGERDNESKTISALQTHVSVVDDKLFLTKTAHGLPDDRVNRAITLSAEERAKVTQILSDNRLLGFESIRLIKQPQAQHSYGSASIKLRIEGVEHSFSVAGVTELDGNATAFSQTAAFRSVLRVVKDLDTLARQRD